MKKSIGRNINLTLILASAAFGGLAHASEYDSVARSFGSTRISAAEVGRQIKAMMAWGTYENNCQVSTQDDGKGHIALTLKDHLGESTILIDHFGYKYSLGGRAPKGQSAYGVVYADSDDKSRPRLVLKLQFDYTSDTVQPNFLMNITREYYGTVDGQTDWYDANTLNGWNKTQLPPSLIGVNNGTDCIMDRFDGPDPSDRGAGTQ